MPPELSYHFYEYCLRFFIVYLIFLFQMMLMFIGGSSDFYMRRVVASVRSGTTGTPTDASHRHQQRRTGSTTTLPIIDHENDTIASATSATTATSTTSSGEKKRGTNISPTRRSTWTRPTTATSRLSSIAANSMPRPFRRAVVVPGERASLLGIDEDIILLMLTFCQPSSVAILGITCRALQSTTSLDLVWFDQWRDMTKRLNQTNHASNVYTPSVPGATTWRLRFASIVSRLVYR
jgi:hypothetical protein